MISNGKYHIFKRTDSRVVVLLFVESTKNLTFVGIY
jgi:hypothetical protein